MSTVRVATWNVQGGIFGVTSVQELLVAPEPDLGHISACMRNSGAHLVCLQELSFGRDEKYAQRLAAAAGFEFWADYELSDTPLPHLRMGLGVFSKFPIVSVERIPLPNPNLSVRAANGIEMRSHEKGLLVAEIATPSQRFTIVCGHLLPFHRFRRTVFDDEFRSLGIRMRDELLKRMSRPTIICADFNIDGIERYLDHTGITGYMPIVHVPTRPEGQRHDNILITEHWNAEGIRVVATKSDHHWCVADVAIASTPTPAPPGSVFRAPPISW